MNYIKAQIEAKQFTLDIMLKNVALLAASLK